MDEQNFDFDAWDSIMQAIEQGKSLNSLDNNPTISTIPNIEDLNTINKINTEDPRSKITNFDYLKSLNLQSETTTGKIIFNHKLYGISLSGSQSGYQQRNVTYNFILTRIDLDQPVLYMVIYREHELMFRDIKIYGSIFSNDLNNITINLSKLLDFSDLCFDKEVYEKELLKYEEMKNKNNDLNVEKYLIKLDKNRQTKYKQELEVYEIKLKLATIDDIFTKCCTTVFDDNWDFVRNIESDRFTPDRLYRNRLTIHFPEIEIKNSKKQSHKIYDFYLSLFFNDNFKIYSNIYGRRQTYSLEEFDRSYSHSHCSPDRYHWSKMCLGDDTPLSELVYSMASSNNSFNENNLMKLLLLIQGYIGWESLEGGPHVRMETIGNARGTVNQNWSTDSIKDCYSTIKNNLNVINRDKLITFSNINKFNKFIINSELLESSLGNLSYNSSNYICFKSGDEYYTNNINAIDYENNIARYNRDIQNNINNSRKIEYKGKLITPEIKQNVSNNAETIKCLNPHLFKSVINMLQKDINNYYLKTKNYEFSRIKESA